MAIIGAKPAEKSWILPPPPGRDLFQDAMGIYYWSNPPGRVDASGNPLKGNKIYNPATLPADITAELAKGDVSAAMTPASASAANGIDVTEIGTGTGDTTMAPWTDWSSVFGELDPSAQYQAMMRTQMPNYAMPGYAAMAGRQFDPTFGRYLMQGYQGPTVTDASGVATTPALGSGLGTGRGFADWYGSQFPMTGGTAAIAGTDTTAAIPAVPGTPTSGMGGMGAFTPGDIGAGWNLATQYSGMTPGSADWQSQAKLSPGMAYAMTQPDAVQAMALAKYYGGGQPTGGYAGRAVASTLGNLYNQWQAGQVQQGVTAPSGYLNWLGNTAGSRWA